MERARAGTDFPGSEVEAGLRSSFWVLLFLACDDRTRLVPAYDAEEVVVACTGGEFVLQHAIPEVMLVLDRSSSMSSGSRWSTLVGALETALPPIDATLELGLYVFPSQAVECAVPDAPVLWPATGQVSSLLASVRKTVLVGGTPTAAALDVAAASLSGLKPRALVLATDGLPNCNGALNPATCACPEGNCTLSLRCVDDARTLERLSSLAAAGIPTWIVGVGSDVTSSSLLDAMALAGGRPSSGTHRYAAATSSAELQAAFSGIRDELSACVFTSQSVPDAAGTMVVTLDGLALAQGENGWAWSSASRGELVLRGQACAQAIAAKSPVVRISVICGVDTVQAVVAQ